MRLSRESYELRVTSYEFRVAGKIARIVRIGMLQVMGLGSKEANAICRRGMEGRGENEVGSCED